MFCTPLLVAILGIILVHANPNLKDDCVKSFNCFHNAVEICGEDGDGEIRRFFDECDVHEYNCLHGTGLLLEFVAALAIGDQALIYLQPQETTSPDPIFSVDRAKILKYWCWRAKYCRPGATRVCARDHRLRNASWFQDDCSVFRQNCRDGTDFTVTTHSSCKYR